jgi:hypothetical protein
MNSKHSKVSGTSGNENPYERGTTRGWSQVSLGQDAPVDATTLKELVCSVCGQRSYTLDGACPFRDDILHRMEDLSEKEGL